MTIASPTVTQSADDAFGARIGEEVLGLYSETEVRGFDLQSAGNYRLEGAYFARAVAARDPIVASTAIRVGINAVRFDFPSPSGVVDHRLRRPRGTGSEWLLRSGQRDYASPYVELFGQQTILPEKLRVAGGLQAQPANRFGNDARGDFYAAGIVPELRIGSFNLVAPISFSRAHLDADYAFLATGDDLPPKIRYRRYPAPRWADFKGTGFNGGLVAETVRNGPWSVQASIILSRLDVSRSDFTLLSEVARDGTARALAIRGFPNEVSSLAGEVRLTRELKLLGRSHSITLMARRRSTRSVNAPGTRVEVGRVSLLDPYYPEEPSLSAPDRGQDEVDQGIAGIAYRVQPAPWLEARGGVQKIRYAKHVALPHQAPRNSLSKPWLANGSLIALISSRLTGFMSFIRGLEEAGVAPQTATNRNEILPAALATQMEAGLKYQLRPGLNLIASGFRLEKPYPGFDASGAYGLNGKVRHSGLELSLSGRVTEQVTVVVGALLMEPRRSGPEVEAGLSGARPVGVSSVRGLVSAESRPLRRSALFFSAELSYYGARAANRQNTLETPGYFITNLGSRFPVTIDGERYTIRARVTNLFNKDEWIALPAEILTRVGRRTFRFSVEREF